MVDGLHRRGGTERHQVPLTERHGCSDPEETSTEAGRVLRHIQDVTHEDGRKLLSHVGLERQRLLSCIDLTDILGGDGRIPGLKPGCILRLPNPFGKV